MGLELKFSLYFSAQANPPEEETGTPAVWWCDKDAEEWDKLLKEETEPVPSDRTFELNHALVYGFPRNFEFSDSNDLLYFDLPEFTPFGKDGYPFHSILDKHSNRSVQDEVLAMQKDLKIGAVSVASCDEQRLIVSIAFPNLGDLRRARGWLDEIIDAVETLEVVATDTYLAKEFVERSSYGSTYPRGADRVQSLSVGCSRCLLRMRPEDPSF